MNKIKAVNTFNFLKNIYAFVVLSIPTLAIAAEPGMGMLNEIVKILTGGYAQVAATIGVIGLGYAAIIARRIEMKTALFLILGLVLIFGSAELVERFIDKA